MIVLFAKNLKDKLQIITYIYIFLDFMINAMLKMHWTPWMEDY